MKQEEARELVDKWATAVGNLWGRVTSKANAAAVAAPVLMKKIGNINIILSGRGIEVVAGSSGTTFADLMYRQDFKLSDFSAIREFVVESIAKGHAEVDASIANRASALQSGFFDFKKEIAEWNLIAEQGKEIKS